MNNENLKSQGVFKYEYMLLARLQMDCDYYLGNGGRHAKHLWAPTEVEHIAKMKELWHLLPEKPEWLTIEQIEQYELDMTSSVKD